VKPTARITSPTISLKRSLDGSLHRALGGAVEGHLVDGGAGSRLMSSMVVVVMVMMRFFSSCLDAG
jgi:hypothetical protein